MYGTMMHGAKRAPGRRRWVVAALLLALVAGAPARALATERVDTAARSEYALDGDRLLRLTWSGARDGLGRLMRGEGELVLVLERAVDLGDPLGPYAEPRSPGTPRLAFLGSTPPPGIDPDPLLGWEPRAVLRFVSNLEEVSLSYEVGPDRILVAIPRSELAGESGPIVKPARVTINGATAWLDAAALIQRGEVSAFDGGRTGEELERVFARLEEPEQLVDTIEGVQRLAADSTLTELSGATSSCMAECLSCLGSLGTMGLATFSMGLSCGGVVFSGGMALPICYATIISGLGTVVVAATNCANCDICLHPDVEPEPPENPGSDPGDPGCEPCDFVCPDPPDPACDTDDELTP